MRIAVFSDIHSNIQALRNLLADVREQRPDAVYCLGDLVGYGPRPNEVVSMLKELEIPTVMGNYDDGVAYERGDCGCAYITKGEKADGQASIDWTTRVVTEANKEYLRGLEKQITVEAEGRRLLLVHGSPRRVNEYLYEDRPEATRTGPRQASGGCWSPFKWTFWCAATPTNPTTGSWTGAT